MGNQDDHGQAQELEHFNQHLDQYGTFNPAPTLGLASRSTTDKNGIATLAFTPNTEKVPGFGQVIFCPQTGEPGFVEGIPLYQTAFGGGIASQIAQVIVPKYDVIGCEVARHRPRGFRFTMKKSWDAVSKAPLTPGMTDHLDWTLEGYICGDDPYAQKGQNGADTSPWNVTITASYKETSYDGKVVSGTDTLP